MRSETHQTAVREAFEALRSVRFARFEIGRKDMPVTWDRALAELETRSRGYD